jgi:hypothetical protein
LGNAIILASGEIKCSLKFAVDYLLRIISTIRSQLLEEEVPAAKPEVCTVLPSEIDMGLNSKNRDLITISGYSLDDDFDGYALFHVKTDGTKKDETTKLSRSTEFKLTINLGSNGIILNEDSEKLTLYWNDELITEIPVIHPQIQPCKIIERTLTGLPNMVIEPRHKKDPWTNAPIGDTEFAGNGPCTFGYVQLYLEKQGTELWAYGFVRMWECPDDLSKISGDYTYGDESERMKLATMDHGWRIKSIKDPTKDEFRNIDQIHDREERISGSGPVRSYIIYGDTSGNDLGKSKVVISFKSIKVTLEEIGNCKPN